MEQMIVSFVMDFFLNKSRYVNFRLDEAISDESWQMDSKHSKFGTGLLFLIAILFNICLASSIFPLWSNHRGLSGSTLSTNYYAYFNGYFNNYRGWCVFCDYKQ